GITRSWTNGQGYAQQNIVGNGMVIDQRPTLIQADGLNALAVILDGRVSHYFYLPEDPAPEEEEGAVVVPYEPQKSVQGEFLFATYWTMDPPGEPEPDPEPEQPSEWTWTKADGQQFTFYGFASSVPVKQQGQLKQQADAFGNVIDLTYDEDGYLIEVDRTSTVGST